MHGDDWKDMYKQKGQKYIEEMKMDDVKKKLSKVKGLSKSVMDQMMTLPMPVLTSMVNQLSGLVSSYHEGLNENIGAFPQVGGKFALKKKHVEMIKDIIKSKGNGAASHIQSKMGYSRSAAKDLIDLAQGRAIYGRKLGMVGSGVVESNELAELKTTHVVIDTAQGNKIVSAASSEKSAKSSIVSAEKPPMNIKDKKTLKVVQLKKPVSRNKDILGTTLKEENEDGLLSEKNIKPQE